MKRNGLPRWMPAELPDTADAGLLLRAAAALIPSDTARLDAELLLAHLLRVDRTRLLLNPPPVPAAVRATFAAMVAQRQQHVPVAHLTGEREFWSLPLRVTPDTLIPRPDSETLIEAALRAGSAPRRILDLGTGSGALLLAALSEWPAAMGVGVDRSLPAVQVAQDNAARLGLAPRAHFLVADWATALAGRFELILCNPPYIVDGTALMPEVAAHEPASALYGGADGLDPYRLLFPELPRLLAADGVALFEFGTGQADALQRLAQDCGLQAVIHTDLAGRPRAIELGTC